MSGYREQLHPLEGVAGQLEALGCRLPSPADGRDEAAEAGRKAYFDAAEKVRSAIPDLRRLERERLKEVLHGLHNGPGPDRDPRYQDAWRHGVSDALSQLMEEGDR